MPNELPQTPVHVPTKCSDCAANCLLKQGGCAFDIASALKERSIKVDPESYEKLRVETRTCLAKVQGACHQFNTDLAKRTEEAALIEKVTLSVLKVLKGSQMEAPRPKPRLVERPMPQPAAEDELEAEEEGAESELVEPVNGNGHAGHSQAQVIVTAKANGHASKMPSAPAVVMQDLYASDEDRETEARILAENEPGVHNVCLVPKTAVARIEEYRALARRRFETPPFGGLVGVVAKHHKNNNGVVRIAAYYRGPPPVEAEEVLRKMKSAEKSAETADASLAG